MIYKQSTHRFTKELLSSVLKEQYENFMNREEGVQRDALDKIKKVIKSPHIVVITGLRRVGKSTLLTQAARHYLKDDFYFVNFEDERLLDFQVEDFDFLYETLISLFGEKRTFLFDEIQNVPQWERFVRRLHDQGYKFIITGSNASLLSQELGTRLTGRSIRIELFPFSFREFLKFHKIEIPDLKVLTTKQKGQLLKLSYDYMISGGIPDALKYTNLEIHKMLYDDVIYRDIATRYPVTHVKSLKELAFYFMSNISSLFSFNKLKELLKLGSVNTVKSYTEHLENSWLFFVINKYAYSVKEQQIAAKKIYCVDTGLARSVGFSFSENYGKFMENLVFLELKIGRNDMYYYRTAKDHEVDFFIPKHRALIQVVKNMDDETIRNRELKALLEAAGEQKKNIKLFIVTEREKSIIRKNGRSIHVIPLYEWLLGIHEKITKP